MASRVVILPTFDQTEIWTVGFEEADQLKLSDSSGKTYSYKFEAVRIVDKGAIYEFGKYCALQGKAPADVLRKIEDARLLLGNDGYSDMLMLSTTNFPRIK